MLSFIKSVVKGNNSKTLVAFNIAILIVAIAGLFFSPFTWPLILATLATYYILISFGISITYHRSLTHRALKMHPWVENLGAFVASMAGTGSPIMWVLTHRQHHRYSDKEGDPHPPGGVPKTLLGVYPRVETKGIRDVASNRFFRFMHRYYFAVVLGWGLALLALFGFAVFYHVFVLPVLFSIIISNALNWFGHKGNKLSYRNFNLNDRSQNNPIMAFLAFGEGWHNNHHRYPGSANFGVSKHEVDISYLLILILNKLGLAKSIRVHNRG